MLAAVGATERQVRLVMVANGARRRTGRRARHRHRCRRLDRACPRIEEAAGYRIDALNVPWWPIAAGGLLAIVAAAGAAWWPARTMARILPVLALSGRPLRPAPTHRSAAVAGASSSAASPPWPSPATS